MFVHDMTGASMKEKTKDGIQKLYVAMLHKYECDEGKCYYATIRQIADINKVILTMNLGELTGSFSLSFYEHLNSKNEQIF
jgi:hypothetical protein